MKKNNLQDIFLNSVRKNKISVTIFLFNGIKLQGFIAGFDNFVINLKRDNQLQLVYKHAISTILPSENVDMTIVETDIESENNSTS